MRASRKRHNGRALRLLLMLGVGVGLFLLYVWVYTSQLGYELPGTVLRRQNNADLSARIRRISHRLGQQEEILEGLKLRDELIYRSMFDLPSIPDERRKEGIAGGAERHADLAGADRTGLLLKTALDLDRLEKEVYVQSRSFEEIADIARISGDMASSVPAIPPITPDESTYHLSSRFGYRSDPLNGSTRMHQGVDFACPPGNPVYATGDGVILEANNASAPGRGYGNYIVIDHGFGYKTRYAHLKTLYATQPGMKVRRGDLIGETGRSGRVSGPHLHYEVFFRSQAVNPLNYMDIHMDLEEFRKLVQTRAEDSPIHLGPGRVKPNGK